eukprot:TRINITY_DN1430_c1_g2_i1.p1 TRINITY_DN1430_c1_g2~~TRINITY_DN1430_c1_g2_i1.p1  ORF type:complete len:161 (+),score=42.64 TRINITY_DN1430_c1_g2_i1:101-583(+)
MNMFRFVNSSFSVGILIYAVFSVLVVFCNSQQCVSLDNEPVDFWLVFRLDEGFYYQYVDENSEYLRIILSTKLFEDDGPIKRTIKTLYKEETYERKANTSYVVYSQNLVKKPDATMNGKIDPRSQFKDILEGPEDLQALLESDPFHNSKKNLNPEGFFWI